MGIFFFGSLFGIIVVGFFVKSNDFIGFEFFEFGDLSMDNLFEIFFVGFVKDMCELVVSKLYMFWNFI